MYVEMRPEGFLCDREALSVWLHRSVHTIRKHCKVVDHTRQGTPLYNFEHCDRLLAKVPQRPARRVDGTDEA